MTESEVHHRRSQSVPFEQGLVSQASLSGAKIMKRSSWFNPEKDIEQKRVWADEFKDKKVVVQWPDHMFEHFIVVGLHPSTEVYPSAEDEAAAIAHAGGDMDEDGHPLGQRPEDAFGDALPGEVLYSYPPDKPVSPSMSSFCFPHGIQSKLLRRTPDMKALQDVMYSQKYKEDDSLSFVFLQKAADNLPMWGICCYVDEMVHRPPPMLAAQFPENNKPLSRILVAAPRCYAFLTNFPFFSLHMKVLHMMLGLERADRCRIFSDELLDDGSNRASSKHPGRVATKPAPLSTVAINSESEQIPASALESLPYPEPTPSSSPLIPAGEVSGLQKAQSEDLESNVNVQRILDVLGDVDQDDLSELADLVDVIDAEELQRQHDQNSVASRAGSSTHSPREYGSMAANDSFVRRPSFAESAASQGSTQDLRQGPSRLQAVFIRNSSQPDMQLPNDEQSGQQQQQQALSYRISSFELPEEVAQGGEVSTIRPLDMSEPTAMSLKVMYSYYSSSVPDPGKEWEFKPDPSCQSLRYYRPKVGQGHDSNLDKVKVSISTAEAEAAEGLCTWTVATLCAALKLPVILQLLTAVLLERQTVVFCPNMGVLTAVVLALTPLVRPFAWQSMLLPVLPCTEEMLVFLDAPVPFLVGVQHKTSEITAACGGLVHVDVPESTVKGPEVLPALPNDKLLMERLMPSFNVLSNIGRRQAHGAPLYAVTGIQRTAAEGFLQNMRQYLTGLTSSLAKHTITDVKHNKRTSVLMKDSFIESFLPRERPFLRQFVETQMFSEYVDAVID